MYKNNIIATKKSKQLKCNNSQLKVYLSYAPTTLYYSIFAYQKKPIMANLKSSDENISSHKLSLAFYTIHDGVELEPLLSVFSVSEQFCHSFFQRIEAKLLEQLMIKHPRHFCAHPDFPLRAEQ